MNNERGTFKNEGNAKQLVSFLGIQYGNITPTDLDAMIEYKNTGFVLIETKYQQDFYQEKGQQLAHERMVDTLWVAKKPSVLIFASHRAIKPNSILLFSCPVTKYRYAGKWHEINGWTVKQLVDSFICHLDSLIQARQMQFNAQDADAPKGLLFT